MAKEPEYLYVDLIAREYVYYDDVRQGWIYDEFMASRYPMQERINSKDLPKGGV